MKEFEVIKDFFEKVEFKMNYNYGRANEWYEYIVEEYDGNQGIDQILRKHIQNCIDNYESGKMIEDFDVLDKIDYTELGYILGRWTYDITFMMKYFEDLTKYFEDKYNIVLPKPKNFHEDIQRRRDMYRFTEQYVCDLNKRSSKPLYDAENLKNLKNEMIDVFYSYLYTIIDPNEIYRVNPRKCTYTFGLNYEVFIMKSKDHQKVYVIDLQMWD